MSHLLNLTTFPKLWEALFYWFEFRYNLVQRAKEISTVIRNDYGRYDNVPVKVKAELFQFSVDDFEVDMKLHSLVLKELNVRMYSSELYDDYMSIVDATDKKKLGELQKVDHYSKEKRWNQSR